MEFGQVHKASSAPQKQALYLCISKQAHRISLLYNFLLTRYFTSQQYTCKSWQWSNQMHALHLDNCSYNSSLGALLILSVIPPVQAIVGQGKDLTKLSIAAVECHCHQLKLIYIAKTLYQKFINLFVTHKSRSLFGMWTYNSHLTQLNNSSMMTDCNLEWPIIP